MYWVRQELFKLKDDAVFYNKWIRYKYVIFESALLALILFLTIMAYVNGGSFSDSFLFKTIDVLTSVSIIVMIITEILACGYLAFFRYKKYYKKYILDEPEFENKLKVERKVVPSKAKFKRAHMKKILDNEDNNTKKSGIHTVDSTRVPIVSNSNRIKKSRNMSLAKLQDSQERRKIDLSVAGNNSPRKQPRKQKRFKKTVKSKDPRR